MKKVMFAFLCFFSSCCVAQDISFGRKILDTLTSPFFWGRGYTNDGMRKAADFLSTSFKSYGLTPINGKSFLQDFHYPVNTFPSDMALSINGQQLIPGIDFIVSPDAKGIKSKGKLEQKDSITFVNIEHRFVVRLEDKLTWSVSQEESGITVVMIDKHKLTGDAKTFEVDIENKFIKKFNASNVCAVVKGTAFTDSVIMITAHYDHLGGMGSQTYFPGANDNASGISLLLNLAQYYAKNPQKYSIGFICFAGEEAGLVGSKYFTEHPLVPLKKIRFLLNTDLAGTGEEGITVVNATEFPAAFALMNAINDEHKLITKINPRGKAANSDHYFFSEKGVPAFFFYTLGGIKAYHDVFDIPATLPLNEHEDLFKLILKFNKKLMGN